jgi:threonine synthase
MWRYLELLPVSAQMKRPPLRVGWTPLYRSRWLEEKTGIQKVWIKDDTQNPTASLKDRASAVAVSRALAEGSGCAACASTGNAACSLAGLAASVGLPVHIYVPERAPRAKLAQLLVFGAHLHRVSGSYADAFQAATEAISAQGWYNRNCAINPYLVEGKKTASLEVWEQLGYAVPEAMFVPVGDGCTLAGQFKAFWELRQLGLSERMPRLYGVQAFGCQPIAEAWRRGAQEASPAEAHTIADSIAVGTPRNSRKAIKAVRESGGAFVTVSDEAILQAVKDLAAQMGIFAEPAAAAALAGFLCAVQTGVLKEVRTVVILITGSGLKDVEAALRACGEQICSEG